MNFFIGVDGGASKTAALVVDEQGDPLGRGLSGGSNHLAVGIEEATRNIQNAVNSALAEAGLGIESVEYVYCGIAGVDHPVHRARLVSALHAYFNDNFTIDMDSRIALTGAVGFGTGIAIVAGTGSIAFGRNSAGEEDRAGGWGPTLGDEGSGYWIAREGLSAIVRAHDGRSPRTALTDLLCSDFHMCKPEDLPQFVYNVTTHADDIARYGQLVVHAAELGDGVACGILKEAGAELAKCAIAVARKLSLENDTFPVAYVGGAFKAGELLIGPMRSALSLELQHAVVQPPKSSPVEGAAQLAIRASHQPRQRARA